MCKYKIIYICIHVVVMNAAKQSSNGLTGFAITGIFVCSMFFAVCAFQLYQSAPIRSSYGIWITTMVGLVLFSIAWTWVINPGAPQNTYVYLSGAILATICAIAIVIVSRHRTSTIVRKMQTDNPNGDTTPRPDAEKPFCIHTIQQIATAFTVIIATIMCTLYANLPSSNKANEPHITTYVHSNFASAYMGNTLSKTERLVRYLGLFVAEFAIAFFAINKLF